MIQNTAEPTEKTPVQESGQNQKTAAPKSRKVRIAVGISICVLLAALIVTGVLIFRHRSKEIDAKVIQHNEEAAEQSAISIAEIEWNDEKSKKLDDYINNSYGYAIQDYVITSTHIKEESAEKLGKDHYTVTQKGTADVTFYEKDNTLSKHTFDYSVTYDVTTEFTYSREAREESFEVYPSNAFS